MSNWLVEGIADWLFAQIAKWFVIGLLLGVLATLAVQKACQYRVSVQKVQTTL